VVRADGEVRQGAERERRFSPIWRMHHFKTGHKVRFADDASHRWPPGKVAGLTSDGRLIVEVEVMGRVVPFHVYPHLVEKC
jgi:hypothetical protein